jgi:hypothetical protein
MTGMIGMTETVAMAGMEAMEGTEAMAGIEGTEGMEGTEAAGVMGAVRLKMGREIGQDTTTGRVGRRGRLTTNEEALRGTVTKAKSDKGETVATTTAKTWTDSTATANLATVARRLTSTTDE